MTDKPLFIYGTLRHAPLYAAVAGEALAGTEALLSDHVVAEAMGQGGRHLGFPLFTPRPGGEARGLLVRPGTEARARLDFYEVVFGYDPAPVRVQVGAEIVEAVIYLPREGLWHPGPLWSLADWARDQGDLVTETAIEVMALRGVASPQAVLERYGMLTARVASRRRALATPAPATLRRPADPADVKIETLRRPYTWFFGVEESDLRFRHFDGRFSPVVTRAGFVMADAVTVLPYDPVRDAVMLVEQFRYGPHSRGEANAWSLEPVAGRIDGLETPEAAARREAMEEARLELGALHRIASYYVSPGAVTEHITSFVAIADLPGSAEGVSGLETEAENIRAHVIPFSRLMDLIVTGEAANAPVLVSAQWLALNRERLRRA